MKAGYSRVPLRLVILFSMIVAACGGTVFEDGSDTGGTGGAGAGGSGGTNTGGANTGGTAASGNFGGTGGASTGATGGTAGTAATGNNAGTGGTNGGCDPLPFCNWCNGITLYDSNGCPMQYECANGVDPCVTDPCDPEVPATCPEDHVCGADMLCWPSSQCSMKDCTVTPTWGCTCSWSCGGDVYDTRCISAGTGAQECDCIINNHLVSKCKESMGSAGGPGDWCGDPTCCEFPEPGDF